MGLHNGTCTVEQLEEAKDMIPAALEAHLVDLYKNPNLYDRSNNSHPTITPSPVARCVPVRMRPAASQLTGTQRMMMTTTTTMMMNEERRE